MDGQTIAHSPPTFIQPSLSPLNHSPATHHPLHPIPHTTRHTTQRLNHPPHIPTTPPHSPMSTGWSPSPPPAASGAAARRPSNWRWVGSGTLMIISPLKNKRMIDQEGNLFVHLFIHLPPPKKNTMMNERIDRGVFIYQFMPFPPQKNKKNTRRGVFVLSIHPLSPPQTKKSSNQNHHHHHHQIIDPNQKSSSSKIMKINTKNRYQEGLQEEVELRWRVGGAITVDETQVGGGL